MGGHLGHLTIDKMLLSNSYSPLHLQLLTLPSLKPFLSRNHLNIPFYNVCRTTNSQFIVKFNKKISELNEDPFEQVFEINISLVLTKWVNQQHSLRANTKAMALIRVERYSLLGNALFCPRYIFVHQHGLLPIHSIFFNLLLKWSNRCEFSVEPLWSGRQGVHQRGWQCLSYL